MAGICWRHMTTLSISEWKDAMENVGFCDIELHQVAGKDEFPGTLVMLGRATRLQDTHSLIEPLLNGQDLQVDS